MQNDGALNFVQFFSDLLCIYHSSLLVYILFEFIVCFSTFAFPYLLELNHFHISPRCGQTNLVFVRDALIIGQLSAVLPIIGIGQLVRWYRLIVVYTIGKYKFLFLVPKVNEQ